MKTCRTAKRLVLNEIRFFTRFFRNKLIECFSHIFVDPAKTMQDAVAFLRKTKSRKNVDLNEEKKKFPIGNRELMSSLLRGLFYAMQLQ